MRDRPIRADDASGQLAAAMLDFRQYRARELPAELFAEPAWDVLLALFVADARGVQMTGQEISGRYGVAPSILSPWLKHLTKLRLIVGDGTGDLSDPLVLTAGGLERIERILMQARSLRAALDHVS